ncbi:AsmA family protein [Frateuria hangzhouensis]|uniref:AsmA family protein n=1 Tax=Frateuria hangzhouensis TaxID=2995589 RepID=UPI00226095B8|nr:AsmA family protein [Frateuria sp. STR12]MCX7513107.1 AsmA family protein [Frateuria sp. STR12]
MTRRLRIALLGLTGVLVAGLIALLVTVYLLLQPARFTAMLQDQARQVGLELSLASPASPTLFPRPALELQGLTLTAQGASMPILLAANGRLALPWSTLFGGPTVISRLEIDAPRVDLDALQAWLSRLPSGAAGAPNIPRIDTGVRIARGTLVRSNQLLLRDFALDAGSLLTGEPFPLVISAKDAGGTPMQLSLTATPRIQGNALQLNNIDLNFTRDASTSMRLTGEAHWHGAADAAATLAGSIDQADAGRYDISLHLTPANQSDPLLLALKLDGPGNHVDLRLPPLGVARWWSHVGNEEGPQLNVPPGSGHVEAATLDMAGVHVEGLQLQFVPAPAASTSAPATPATSDAR